MAEIVVVHGYPGSGKSYLCERTAKEGIGGIEIQHVSMGDRLDGIRKGIIESRFSERILADPLAHPTDEIATGIVFEPVEEADNKGVFLFDSFPSYAGSYDKFCEKVRTDNHAVIGVVDCNTSITKSEERVASRGRRDGDKLSETELKDHAIFRYRRDDNTSKIIVMMLMKHGIPWAEIDTSGSKTKNYRDFSRTVGGFVLNYLRHSDDRSVYQPYS